MDGAGGHPRIVFHIGGPGFHPVAEQAAKIIALLGPRARCRLLDGVDALEGEVLDQADLLVLMGLHWTGMAGGDAPMVYRPMEPRHREALARYVHAGKPILAHHGAVASYDDWPDFGELVGIAWVWGKTSHSPLGMHTVTMRDTRHPVIQGVEDFTLFDELYYDLQLAADVPWQVHAQATWESADRPMVLASERDARRGRRVYLANGHDMRAFECPALLKLWMNSINWLCERE